MSRPPRTAARRRLAAGFLGGLPDELQALAALAAEVEEEEDWESVAYALERLGETARSLELSSIADAVNATIAGLGQGSVDVAFAPLVKAIRESSPVGPFAPIAIVGNERQVQSIAQQDDGTCEPLQLYNDVRELQRLIVQWPQAIAIPGTEVAQVGDLMRAFGCAVYVYGAARDQNARMEASRSGATGYLAEPVVLTEFLAALRYRNSLPKRPTEVALLGAAEWSAPILAELTKRGMRATAFTDVARVGAVLHSQFPDVVVLGRSLGKQRNIVVQMIRGHVGRSHVAILGVGTPRELRSLGVDGVAEPDEDLYEAVQTLLERMRDHHRDRDVLTQLPNRAGILASAQRALAWSERHADPVTIGLVRADGLERAAREHGIDASNACQRHLAISLQRGLRRLDEVGFLGDGLFCAILYNTRADQVGPRLEQLCAAFVTRAHADRRLREVSISTAVCDSSVGVRGLLPRTLRQLTGT